MTDNTDRPAMKDFISPMKVGEVKEWPWVQSLTNVQSVQKDLCRVARGMGWHITTRRIETGKKKQPYLIQVKLLSKKKANVWED